MALKLKIDWAAQPLGKLSDRAIARRLGVVSSTVWRARLRYGIAAYAPYQAVKAWLRANAGRYTDREIAARFGMTSGSVAEMRRRLRLPPKYPRSASHRALKHCVKAAVRRSGPATSKQVHMAVLDDYGHVSQRQVIRTLQELVREGKIKAQGENSARRYTARRR